METAVKLDDTTMFEQGAGLFDLKGAYDYFHHRLVPKVSLFPASLNLAEENPYTFPYSLQPLYETGAPTILNLTILNSLNVQGKVTKIEFHSRSTQRMFISVSVLKIIFVLN